MLNRAQSILCLLEERTVTVAWHDPGHFEGYYRNADIFGFELWNVPTDSTVLSTVRLSKSYDGLFKNMTVIPKKELKQFNPTKQRISFELNRVSRIYIPDSVWQKLKIVEPRKDQILFMQCLYILYKSYSVKAVGMDNPNNISAMKS